jgi:hypothetical protein
MDRPNHPQMLIALLSVDEVGLQRAHQEERQANRHADPSATTRRHPSLKPTRHHVHSVIVGASARQSMNHVPT